MSNTEREAMEYDVVIVGAGPSGLSGVYIRVYSSNIRVNSLNKRV